MTTWFVHQLLYWKFLNRRQPLVTDLGVKHWAVGKLQIQTSCSKCMVPIWHNFANSFYLIFIIFRWIYTFWWKDHVKKATIKAKSKARMLYNLQPFKKMSDFSKWMVLINFKVDFEHLFGHPKQLFIDRELISMWTDVNR